MIFMLIRGRLHLFYDLVSVMWGVGWRGLDGELELELPANHARIQ